MLNGVIGYIEWICNESGVRDGTYLCECVFSYPSLIWPFPQWDIHYGSFHFTANISRVSDSSPYAVGPNAAASSFNCSLTAAGTVNAAVWYMISQSQELLAVASHSGWSNSSTFNWFYKILSTCCSNILQVVTIILLSSSSLQRLPRSVYWSNCVFGM